MKHSGSYLFAKLFFSFILVCLIHSGFSQTYLDSNASIDDRVNDLLSRMTIDEKIGQMTQVNHTDLGNVTDIQTYFLGSLLSGGGAAPSTNTAKGWADMYDKYQSYALKTPLKIPMIYGIDAVHGHNNVPGAVIYPHHIGMGCIQNPTLVEQAARATAEEIAATGLDWTFAPCVAVARNERWGRTYESFSESPDIVKVMGVAEVIGFQGNDLKDSTSILACAKHFIGDGGTSYGTDQGNTVVDTATLRKIHLPGYIAAVNAGVGSVMISFSSWNGSKCHGNKYLITDLLKGELGFNGLVVSDWGGIDQVNSNYTTAVQTAINAGIDMVMVPVDYKTFITTLKTLNTQNKVSTDRIDDAVKRILTIKFRMGLFEKPYTNRNLMPLFGSDEHRNIGRECVKQSIVVLKNENDILPISKSIKRIHISGSHADNIGLQCGGWTISWQGSAGNITKGTTILQAIKNTVPNVQITTSADGKNAQGADYAIAIIGETPYAEGNGDRYNLALNASDITMINNLKSSGSPVIVCLVSGRPMIINDALSVSDAFLALWLPGTEGQGVADVLFGDYNPTAKLSFSWPNAMSQIPVNVGDVNYSPLFTNGYGLTYTITGTDKISAEKYPLVLYPIPASEQFFIRNIQDIDQINIYTISGQLIYSENISHEKNVHFVNVTNWNKGLYVVQCKGKNGIDTKKIIVD